MKLHTYFLCLAFLFFSACGDQKTIQIAGSQTVFPIVTQAIEQFRQSHPDIDIVISAGGSGLGIDQLGKNKIQIAMASRDVTWEEKKQYPSVDFQHHAIAKDAVVPAVSAQILASGIRALSLRQIGDIYAGKITNWKTLRGPDQDIHVIDTEQRSGTRHIFMARILKDRHAQTPGVDEIIASDKDRLTEITQHNAAIGMLPRALLNRTIPGVGIIVAGGVIIPIAEHIKTNKYPISRELFLITDAQPTGNVKKFIDFLQSAQGQQLVQKASYVPITQN